jgi:hypothetical protein
MSTKSPECWAIDPQVDGLRVETAPGRAITLPFNQFAFAESMIDDKGQRLKIHFATHDILIEGHNLRRIEIAMQKRELSFVAKVSTNYQPLVNQGQPVILKITVNEIVTGNKPSQTNVRSEQPD